MDSSIEEKIEKALEQRQPFAAYAMPGEDDIQFLSRPMTGDEDASEENRAYLDIPDWQGFFINRFGNDEEYTVGISRNPEPANPSAGLNADIIPTTLSTSAAEHGQMVRTAISRIERGKVDKIVLAQVTAALSQRSPSKAFMELHGRFPNTFRYICYTAETGIWMAATPELLVDYDVSNYSLHTMALAGTREAGCASPWDYKNYVEHTMVVTFILNILNYSHFLPLRRDFTELRYGKIEHLYTPIDAYLRSTHRDKAWEELNSLMRTLSPTPAICGFPPTTAYTTIRELESFDRHCYGGYVGVKEGTRIRAFVNLRCAFVAPCVIADGSKAYLYNVYAGGGITEDSIPEDEWKETLAKAQSMLVAVTGETNPERKRVIEDITLK